MTKFVAYVLMIFLSGVGAGASALFSGPVGIARGAILGSLLASAVAIGDIAASEKRLKNLLIQIFIGITAGAIAGILIIGFDLEFGNSGFDHGVNSKPMIIFICILYGMFFQSVIVSQIKNKGIKLFFIAFICYSIRYHYIDSRFEFRKFVIVAAFTAVNAIIFTCLWYFPIWFFYTRKHSIASYARSIPLNFRMLKLVLQKRWLSRKDYAASYDQVAATYDDQWLCQLRPVTEKLLNDLPQDLVAGQVLDIGCGTGLSTSYLEDKYPDNPVFGIDISDAMLDIAKSKCTRSEFIRDDILDFLKARPDNSASIIFSGWTIGYSKPSEIIKEASRVLKPGGTFAFVVNYFDTLAPVFYAFRKCMNKFPSKVNMALNPRFPHEARNLLKPLKSNGFTIQMQEDGNIPIHSPDGDITLEWLLKTGVLTGFDQVMPLRDDPEIADYFNKVLSESKEIVKHHYFMGIFKNK